MLWLTNTCTRVLCKVMTVGQIVLSLVKHKKKTDRESIYCVCCSLKQYELHFRTDFFYENFIFYWNEKNIMVYKFLLAIFFVGKDFKKPKWLKQTWTIVVLYKNCTFTQIVYNAEWIYVPVDVFFERSLTWQNG